MKVSPRTPVALLGVFALAALGGGARWLLGSHGGAPAVVDVGRTGAPDGPAGPLAPTEAAGRVGAETPPSPEGGVARATYDAASNKPFVAAGQVLDDRGRPVVGARVAVYRKLPPPEPEPTAEPAPAHATDFGVFTSDAPVELRSALVALTQQAAATATPSDVVTATFQFSAPLTLSRAALLGAQGDANKINLRIPSETEWLASASQSASGRQLAFDALMLQSGATYALPRRAFAVGSEPTAVRPAVGAADDEEDAGVAVLTDAEGRFEIYADLSNEDAYALRADGDCCLSSSSQAFDFGARGVVVRTDCWAALAARVELNGRRLAGRDVRVRVVDSACVGRTAYESGSGRDGLFRADGLSEGTATVEVYVHGGAEPVARIEDVALEAGRCTRDPRLDPLDLDVFARRVRVRVADVAGRPVPGANVRKVTPRLDAGAPSSGACRLLVSEGVLGASGVRTDREGVAEIVVRRTGDHLAVSGDGFISVRLDSVRDDAAATLRRYRVAEVGWTSPPELAAAAEHHAALQPWWDALVSFQPAGGGEGWSATFQSEDAHRFFCETAGRLTVAFRVHAGVENLPYDVVETVPWQGGGDVADVDDPQRLALAPPSRAEMASVLENLAARLERLRSQ